MTRAHARLLGRCHCGQILFSVPDAIDDIYQCDCSLCRMRNAVMANVHEFDFEVLAGQDTLTEYAWNTRKARHFFCSICGTYVFHRKRAMPDHYAVNTACLIETDLSALTVRAARGQDMSVDVRGARVQWPGPRCPA